MSRTIVVTGAGGALGAEVARAAAERGAVVAMIDMSDIPPDRGPQGAGHLRLSVDLADFDSARRAMDEIKAKTGRLDALINVAGGFRWQTLADGELDAWDALFRINLKTAATACKAALPHINIEKGLTLGPALKSFNLISLKDNNLYFSAEKDEDLNTFRLNEKYLTKKSEEYFGRRFNFLVSNTLTAKSERKNNAGTNELKDLDSTDPYEEIILNQLGGEKIA